MKKATFLSRFLAFFLDHIIVMIVAFIIMFFASGFSALAGATNYSILEFISVAISVSLLVVFMFIQFLYFGLQWSKDGQTFGMKIAKIKLVSRSTKQKVTFWQGALRAVIGYHVSGWVFSLGFLWAHFDDNQEAWHDKLFDTWVVKQ